MITVYVDTAVFKEFKSRAEEADLDMSKIVRHLIVGYLAQDPVAHAGTVGTIKRSELEEYVLATLRDYAATNKDHGDLLEWMDKGLGLRPGTLYSLLEY